MIEFLKIKRIFIKKKKNSALKLKFNKLDQVKVDLIDQSTKHTDFKNYSLK